MRTRTSVSAVRRSRSPMRAPRTRSPLTRTSFDRLKLYLRLSADPLLFERMLDRAHLGHKVGVLDESGGSVPSGDDQVQHLRLVRLQPSDHLGGVQPAEVQRVGELVEYQYVEVAGRYPRLRQLPAGAGQVGARLEVATAPRPTVAGAGPGDAHPLRRAHFAERRALVLHELDDLGPQVAPPGAHEQPERGGRLPLAVPGVD